MSVFSNIKNLILFLSNSDIKKRLIRTIFLLMLFRLGGFIALPGVNVHEITKYNDGLLGLLDVFLGGAFSNLSIFGLGIMPYISASIIIHLSTLLFPYFKKIQMDGQSGRMKLNQITKYLTVFIAIIHSIAFMSYSVTDNVLLIQKKHFLFISAFLLTAGSLVCVWIGEKITDYGIGQGISMLIFVGIISSFPSAVYNEYLLKDKNVVYVFCELLILLLIVGIVIYLNIAVRKIQLYTLKDIVEYDDFFNKRNYFPVKMIIAGVMPIIFAQVLMFFFSFLINLLSKYSNIATRIYNVLSDNMSWGYNITFSILIVIFTYLYVAINFNSTSISGDLKRSFKMIPKVKPGKETAKYIDRILNLIIFPGSICLSFFALLPAVAYNFGIDRSLSRFYGGTSMLITIPVVLECCRQIKDYWILYETSKKTNVQI